MNTIQASRSPEITVFIDLLHFNPLLTGGCSHHNSTVESVSWDKYLVHLSASKRRLPSLVGEYSAACLYKLKISAFCAVWLFLLRVHLNGLVSPLVTEAQVKPKAAASVLTSIAKSFHRGNRNHVYSVGKITFFF